MMHLLVALRHSQSMKAHLRDEEGATAVEYGVLVALIIAILVGTIATIGTELLTAFQAVVTQLQA